MRIDVLTIFPEMFPPILGTSILGRAAAKGVVQFSVHNLRDWSKDKHRKVDDRPYGGGPGMVMRPEPFFDAVEEIKKQRVKGSGQTPSGFRPHVLLFSPRGGKLTQRMVRELAARPWLLLLCGHYEGVDERVREGLVNQEISIGDYVLTGGELPAMVLADSVVRLLRGVLGDPGSAAEESFSRCGLEYPQYTRPAQYRGMRVPDVLLSGAPSRVAEWRELQALRRTYSQRPDLIDGLR